jgi:phenylacetate-CoA ligase
VEVLDGERPCPAGVEGDITVTNLHARALPFLRYQVGDRGVLGEGTCPCGTPGPTLERIAGRRGDRIRLPDGRRLSMVAFVSVFHRVCEVRRWQAVQVAPTVLKVRYEAPQSFDPRQLQRYLRELCGPDMAIVLAPSEPIERSPQGKHRVVIIEDDGSA